MSMLVRYRKPGGMQQLVALLETCSLKKRETLLATIKNEDKDFAAQVERKILTMEKIFSWDPLLIGEATARIPERTLAVLLKGCPPEYLPIATHTLKEMKKKEIMTFLETLNPTPVEIDSAKIKLIEKFRELQKEGSLKFDENENPILPAMLRKAG